MMIRKAGFSLVEMLVIIAIISTLAAMLLPSVERAMSETRAIACLTNQRQLYLGISSYADDGRGRLPLSITHGGWMWNRFGMSTACVSNIASVVRLDSNSPLNLAILYAQGYIPDVAPYYCPSGIENNFMTTANWPGHSPTTWSSRYSYNYNVYGMCGIYSWVSSGSPPGFRQTYTTANSFPERKIMLLCDGLTFWTTPPHDGRYPMVFGAGYARNTESARTTAILLMQSPNWIQTAFAALDSER